MPVVLALIAAQVCAGSVDAPLLVLAALLAPRRLLELGRERARKDCLRRVHSANRAAADARRAAEFGVRADRVGLLGLSAGGHLAASAAELFDSPEGRTGAQLDSVSARPDFVGVHVISR